MLVNLRTEDGPCFWGVFSSVGETQKLRRKHRALWALRDARTEHREKQGGPFPRMCVGKLCQARYWGTGQEICGKRGWPKCWQHVWRKNSGIWGKTFIPWFLNYLSSSKCGACVERWGPHQTAKSFPSRSLILKAEVTIKTQIKWWKGCRVLSTVKAITLGWEQEKPGEVDFGDGSRGRLGESTYRGWKNGSPGKQQVQWPAQVKAGSSQKTERRPGRLEHREGQWCSGRWRWAWSIAGLMGDDKQLTFKLSGIRSLCRIGREVAGTLFNLHF